MATATWNGTTVASSGDTVVVVDGQVDQDAAWYSPQPEDAAAEIQGRIAFWKGVQVTA